MLHRTCNNNANIIYTHTLIIILVCRLVRTWCLTSSFQHQRLLCITFRKFLWRPCWYIDGGGGSVGGENENLRINDDERIQKLSLWADDDKSIDVVIAKFNFFLGAYIIHYYTIFRYVYYETIVAMCTDAHAHGNKVRR